MSKSRFERHLAQRRANLARPATPNTGSGLYTGPLTTVAPAGYAGRKGKRPGADKGQKGWDRSPFYATSATVDARWSA